MKTHIPKYRSTLHAVVQIMSKEGVRTLYAGLSPNLLGSTVSWGSYFYCYNMLRGIARREPSIVDSSGQLGPLVNLACATCSGFLTCLATNPIWLIKTRLQLQQGSLEPGTAAHGVRYKGMLDAFVQVFKAEGLAGLYKGDLLSRSCSLAACINPSLLDIPNPAHHTPGQTYSRFKPSCVRAGLVPSLLLVSHGSIQFATYEEIKQAFRRYNGGHEHLSTLQTLAASSLSKV
jgi:hypothetical protein